MALELRALLSPDPLILAVAAIADLTIGDPAYAWHPVRLIGRTLTRLERRLRRSGADGYGGGIVLCVALSAMWVALWSVAVAGSAVISPWLAWAVHAFGVYSFLALGDLIRHVWRIESHLLRGDLASARAAVSNLVGRDTASMDAAACRRAAVESLSENLTDGFTSPVCWYVVAGLPGLVFFKVASTLDSMVGYKTAPYLRFGWCGARLDDVLNYVPARLTWLVLSAVAAVLPRCSGRKALRVGLGQHAVLPGPNSGWSEASAAGAIQRRLIGPIWMNGELVTDTWIGDAADPPLTTHDDLVRALVLVVATGAAFAVIGAVALSWFR